LTSNRTFKNQYLLKNSFCLTIIKVICVATYCLRFAGLPEPGFPLKPQFLHTLLDRGCSEPHSGQAIVASGSSALQ
jgi:hypothetical protein